MTVFTFNRYFPPTVPKKKELPEERTFPKATLFWFSSVRKQFRQIRFRRLLSGYNKKAINDLPAPAAAIVEHIEINPITKFTIAPINAPFPADLALNGHEFLQTRKRINPTTGMKKLRIAKPMLGASSGSVLFPLTGTPHFGQTTALSSICSPQLGQYIIIPP